MLHVDMDAFFASVEVLANPSLAGRAVVVGGTGLRGVVASCSYEARAHGVRSAMPTARARRLCPDAVFLQGRYEAYAAASRALRDVLRSFTPLVEGLSLDEAFVDVAGAHLLFGTSQQIGCAIREKVRRDLGLNCSVGVACSKLVAKLASKAAKPVAGAWGVHPGKGVVVVGPSEEEAFLGPLPAAALPGVGPATESRLSRMGLRRVADVAMAPREALVRALGPAAGALLHDLARGVDPRKVEPGRDPGSIGHEQTFAEDLRDAALLSRHLVRMADLVSARLRAERRAARTVSIKVRFGDFSTVTRSRTLERETDAGPVVASVAIHLLGDVDCTRGVRLLGVSCSGLLEPAGRQLALGLDSEDRWARAARAVDSVRERFGPASVAPAALVAAQGGLDVKRFGERRWGPPA